MSELDDLRQENEALIQFLYLVPVGLVQVDVRGEVAMMNSTGAQYLMPLAETPMLTNLFDVLDPYAPELRNIVRLHSDAQGVICEGRRIDLRAMGKVKGPGHLALGLVKIDPERVMAVVQDVTRTVEQERAIYADQQRFRAIYEGMREAMICTLGLDETVESWNDSGERLFGFSAADVGGKTLNKLIAPAASGDHELGAARAEPQWFEGARRAGWSELSGWSVRKDGSRFWAEGVLSALRDPSGAVSGFSVVLRDLTSRKVAADKLRELAMTDTLTGLANRRTFFEYAEKEVARTARYRTPFSLLMVDADRFKAVNDTHGHAAGDEVLRHLAAVLKNTVRTTDLPARYGGEEFVVLLPETGAVDALILAERLRAGVEAASVVVGDKILRYTISIGVAQAPAASPDLKSILAVADAALYRAKSEGRNRAVLA